MMNQYKEETSQIHAPVELIQRTKQAVREEEKRIQQIEEQRVQSADHVSQYTSGSPAGGCPKFWYSRILRWAVPAAGAAALLILVRASATVLKNGTDNSPMLVSQDTDAGGTETAEMEMQFADNVMGDMVTEAAEEPISANMSDTDEGVTESAEDTAYGMAEEYAGSSSKSDSYEEAKNAETYEASENAADGWGASMYVTEVEAAPSFYDDPNTEQVILYDVMFYVTSDWYGGWAAYASVGGEQYVIVSRTSEEITDYEEYAEKAYELLVEVVGGWE